MSRCDDIERDRCIAICEGWLHRFGDTDIQFTNPKDYASDAIKDIIDAIRDGRQPAERNPVAWRVKDFADGWILFHDENAAKGEAASSGALIQALFAAPAHTSQRESMANDETAWLIEMPAKGTVGPMYHQLEYDSDWTPDANKALRFARRQDAQQYIDHVGWTVPKPVEHMWCAPRDTSEVMGRERS